LEKLEKKNRVDARKEKLLVKEETENHWLSSKCFRLATIDENKFCEEMLSVPTNCTVL